MKCSFILMTLWIGLLLAAGGCQTDLAQTVEETDAQVYDIIDRTWEEEIGNVSNYRIADSLNGTQAAELSEALPDSSILTLPQAVALATAQSRTYATEKDQLYLSALDQIDVRHLYEPLPFAGGTGGYFNQDDVSGVEAYGQFGLSQLLATGAQIGTDISLGWVDVLSGDYRSGFSTVATAVITQPLLRGAGRRIVLENLTQAQRNTLYQIRTFNRFRKEFVTSIITDYYLILEQHDRYLNARDYYYALTQTYQTLEKRASAGLLPDHELRQADQDRLEALSFYIQARKDYQNMMDEFKLRLAIPPQTDVTLDPAELKALQRAMADDLQLSEEQAVSISLMQRLDLMNALDRVDDAQRKVHVAADAIRTELNLVGIADNETLDSETTSKYYELSLDLDLPIDRVIEKNAYRRALIVLGQSQRDYQELMDILILQVRKAYREAQEAQKRYQIESESYQLAQKRSKNTLLLLQYDRANTRDVLDAREDLLDAENAATAALVDYAIAGLELFRDTGTMKIKPDGMWEKAIPESMQVVQK